MALIDRTSTPPKVFETERLLGRTLRSGDAYLTFENWARSEEVTRFLIWRPHHSIEESVAHAERCGATWDDRSSYVARSGSTPDEVKHERRQRGQTIPSCAPNYIVPPQ